MKTQALLLSISLAVAGISSAHAQFPRPAVVHGTALGVIDMERAAKVSGSRFAYLLGDLPRLEFALVRYALDIEQGHGGAPEDVVIGDRDGMVTLRACCGLVDLAECQDSSTYEIAWALDTEVDGLGRGEVRRWCMLM